MSINKNDHLVNLKSTLNEFCTFIEPFRAILNNHNVQFLVDNHYLKFSESNPDLVQSLEKVASVHKNLIQYSLNYDFNKINNNNQ